MSSNTNFSPLFLLSTGAIVGAAATYFHLGATTNVSSSSSSSNTNSTNSQNSNTNTPRRKTITANSGQTTARESTPVTRTGKLSVGTSNNLAGKVVVVVGAKSKIGIAICRAVHSAGAKVVIADSRLESLKKIRDNLNNGTGEDSPASRIHAPPKSAAVVMTDVTSDQSVKRLARKTIEEFGTVDTVVNIAGYQKRSLLKDCEEKEWSKTMNINCKGLLNIFGAFLPTMVENESGQIISVSSEASSTFYPKLTLYGATKQFVETISNGANRELSELGIQVTTIQAGDCKEELEGSIGCIDGEEEFSQLNPADVADAVLFAATSSAEVKSVKV
jgi:NADP-dependent 3-hydroxy acid dehydrogenase YdfG